jgi:hypothetical protein
MGCVNKKSTNKETFDFRDSKGSKNIFSDPRDYGYGKDDDH